MPERIACFKYTSLEYFHTTIASLLLIIVQVASALPAEGFDPLNLHEDEGETTIGIGAGQPGHDGEHGEKGITLFQVHWDHVSAPLTIAFWFMLVTIAKIVFHRFQRMHNLLPDSALLIVLGLFFGYLFHLVYPDEVYLKPDWFFLYLLPPIALDAGYFMPNKDFFRNFGTIMTYAVFGTLYNTVSIGLTLYFLRGYFKMQPSLIEILIFSTLISAVDPVAVLCVFEEIHVNQLLYICVFGESLLNDAVTIVLYQTFNAMLGAGNLDSADYAKAGASFFVVSLGGILIGIIWALLTGYTTKHASHLNVVQPLICLLFPYLAYLSSEMVAMSGILAIVMCGLTMKQFVVGNLSRKSLVTVQYFMKTLSSSCEAVIFVYLGISAVSKNHDWDVVFIAVTITSCLLQRFIGVFLLTWLLNIRRVQKIGVVDQFIMSYGGIRGAVCYGLVMSLNGQGATIKWLVKLLKVKQNEVHKKTIFEMVSENVINNMMCGVEGIMGYRGHYWLRQAYNRFNDNYIKPHLMCDTKSGATRLVDYHEHIQVKEAVQHLKEYGSFAGLPTVQSRALLVTSSSEVVRNAVDDSTYTNDGYVNPEQEALSPRTPPSLPRNKSLSVLVRDKLDSLNSPVSQGVYSRHLLGVDNVPHFSRCYDTPENDLLEALENSSYHMTYPYCKGAKMTPLRRKSRGGVQTDRQRYHHNGDRSERTNAASTNFAPRISLSENSTHRPRFLITSDANDFASSPPNAPRHPRRKSTEQELEEGLSLNLLSRSGEQPTHESTTKSTREAPRSAIPHKSTAPSKKSSAAGEPDERCNLLPVIEIDETESPTSTVSRSDGQSGKP
uniref:Sodium/hydrogen exchanger n=1 Tax=Ascaris suum TaxID=6253 RepID=F1KT70_ASCSU